MMNNDILDDGHIDDLVTMDENVAESDHTAEWIGKILRQPAALDEDLEEIAIRPRLPEALVGDDVGRGIQGRLDRDLERVLNEALLADVSADRLRMDERLELADATLDLSEFLGKQLGVGHGLTTSIRRYRRR